MIRIGYALLGISGFLLGCYWTDIDLLQRHIENIPIFFLISMIIFAIISYPFKFPGEK